MDYVKELIESFTDNDLILFDQYIKWLKDSIKHYKSAIKKLQKARSELRKDIRSAELLKKNHSAKIKKLRVHGGFSWYTSQEEIWRFFIKTKKESINFDNAQNYISDSRTAINEMSRLSAKFIFETVAKIIGIKIIKIILLNENNYVNASGYQFPKEIMDGLTEKISNKIREDYRRWKSNYLFGKEIPEIIKSKIDPLFNDIRLVYGKFKTLDQEQLDGEKIKLSGHIYQEILNLIELRGGSYDEIGIEELIDTILSENFYLPQVKDQSKTISPIPGNEELNNPSRSDYGSLETIVNEFLKKYKEELKLQMSNTLNSTQKMKIIQIVAAEYPNVNISSFLAKLRSKGYAKPQRGNY